MRWASLLFSQNQNRIERQQQHQADIRHFLNQRAAEAFFNFVMYVPQNDISGNRNLDSLNPQLDSLTISKDTSNPCLDSLIVNMDSTNPCLVSLTVNVDSLNHSLLMPNPLHILRIWRGRVGQDYFSLLKIKTVLSTSNSTKPTYDAF